MPNRKLPVFNNRVPTPADKKRARQRAIEWQEFRRNYLFSQAALADHLKIARRTLQAIEAGETLWPSPDLLRRFRDLKQQQELRQKRYEQEMEVA